MVTANTSMYLKCNESLHDFLSYYTKKNLSFLSGEVLGDTLEEMLEEAKAIQAISKDIVIKIDCHEEGLKLCSVLSKQGIKTAMTLVFILPQAMACIQAGADYIFAFIGRNEEQGTDGMAFITQLQQVITTKGYAPKVVAASIKNSFQVQEIIKANIDYAAIPYDLYKKALYHPLNLYNSKKITIN